MRDINDVQREKLEQLRQCQIDLFCLRRVIAMLDEKSIVPPVPPEIVVAEMKATFGEISPTPQPRPLKQWP